MNAEQMHARAIAELADAFSRVHEQPEQDAQAFLAKLARAGWRPLPNLVDGTGPARTQPSPRAGEYIAQIKQTLTERKAER